MLVESFIRTRWLDKLRPAGASQKAEGPEGPMAPLVTAGVSIVGKNFSRVILELYGPRHSFCIVPRKILELCVSSLRPSHAIFAVFEKRSHANLSTNTYISRIMRVSLAHGPCKYSSNHRPRFSHCTRHPSRLLFFFKKKKVCSCHPCTKGHAKFLCAFF